MVEYRYGPVELYLVGFAGNALDRGVIEALLEQMDNGLVRVLDFLIVSKSTVGTLESREIADSANFLGLADLSLAEKGLVGDEDVQEFGKIMEPESMAALVAIELLYARTLAERVVTAGGVFLRSERIPAPVVNALLVDHGSSERGVK